MKPHVLAASLVEIIARHTTSEEIWRQAELTDAEMCDITAEVGDFLGQQMAAIEAKRAGEPS